MPCGSLSVVCLSSRTLAEKSLQACVRSKDANTVPLHQSCAIFPATTVDNVSVSSGHGEEPERSMVKTGMFQRKWPETRWAAIWIKSGVTVFKSKHGTGGRQGKRELYYGGVKALNLRPLAFIKKGIVTENGNCGLSIGVASNPNVTGRFLLEEAETLLGKPLKKKKQCKRMGVGPWNSVSNYSWSLSVNSKD